MMTWDIPTTLGGPVLRWELLRAVRHLGPRLLRYLYVLFLVGQLWMLLPELPTSGRQTAANRRAVLVQWTTHGIQHTSLLLRQQLLLIVLLTPAVTAGALGQEKERNTLPLLLGTQLGPVQIVTGKLLGRLALLSQLLLPAVPVLVFTATLGNLPAQRLLLALAQAAVLTGTIAAICMLTSVWTRRAGDAILACYAALIVGYVVTLLFVNVTWLPSWLDPLVFLDDLLTSPQPPRLAAALWHLGAWAAVGFFCFVLAIVRLRPACLRQADHRVSRWLWALRPPVGDDPVRWRERHILGLAPLPWLRIVPTWMALLGVLAFSAIFMAISLDYAAGRAFLPALERGHFLSAYQAALRANPERIGAEVGFMGIILILLGGLVVGIRCAGSISEEKRRKTWEDLVLTPLSLDEIVRAKMWGVLQAAVPYLAAYAVPMFLLASLGGSDVVVAAFFWVAGAAVVMLLAAYGASEYLLMEDRSIRPLAAHSTALPHPTVSSSSWGPFEEEGEPAQPPPSPVTPDRRHYKT